MIHSDQSSGSRCSSSSPFPGRKARRWPGSHLLAPRHQDLTGGQEGGRVIHCDLLRENRSPSRSPWKGYRARHWPGRSSFGPPVTKTLPLSRRVAVWTESNRAEGASARPSPRGRVVEFGAGEPTEKIVIGPLPPGLYRWPEGWPCDMRGGWRGNRCPSRPPWPGCRSRRWPGGRNCFHPPNPPATKTLPSDRRVAVCLVPNRGEGAGLGPSPRVRVVESRRWPGCRYGSSLPPPGPCRWAGGWPCDKCGPVLREPVAVQVPVRRVVEFGGGHQGEIIVNPTHHQNLAAVQPGWPCATSCPVLRLPVSFQAPTIQWSDQQHEREESRLTRPAA